MSFLSNIFAGMTSSANGTSNDTTTSTTNAPHPLLQTRLGNAGASGGFSDRQRAISSLTKLHVDVILHAQGRLMEPIGLLFDPTFIENLAPAPPVIAHNGIKVAVNAGAGETHGTTGKERRSRGAALGTRPQGGMFTHLRMGEDLKDCAYTSIYSQCYLGAADIAESLKKGAHIVLCGRVADTARAGMWWHDWNRDNDVDQIAGSLICGHLVECTVYIIGGYFSGFMRLMDGCNNIELSIAELFADGRCATVSKERRQDRVLASRGVMRYQIHSYADIHHQSITALRNSWIRTQDHNVPYLTMTKPRRPVPKDCKRDQHHNHGMIPKPGRGLARELV
ncbi:hypothetical protein K504DRAFT_538548 [Pleomassaria siparia CBS 279.74]|uniref:Acyclic terpene utilisation N-terminal domain-containing protein n=1 Tax=Pleomassaria siparia CBS 279.74 TaxID=1314801 RepID=A0A6G1JTW4_9PLEO|nr:hypothetical protein K504DRAFT_538548 [Pleomassaria siparia CBS 279.74]